MKHYNYLVQRGYIVCNQESLPKITPKQVFQKRFTDDLYINIIAYNPACTPDGVVRYEIEFQFHKDIAMSVIIFTLFEHDIVERLPRIEQYIIRLYNAFLQEQL